jgi:hypothetical protein
LEAAGRRSAGEADVTEGEWLNSADPKAMLALLRESGKLSGRKARLFAVACVRQLGELLTEDDSRTAVEVAERYADGLATDEELAAASAAADEAVKEVDGEEAATAAAVDAADAACGAASEDAADAASYTLDAALQAVVHAGVAAIAAGMRGQSDLLRDLFGPLPFHEVRIDPSWLVWNNGIVQRLAEGIYQERAFERMPVLGDALEEAGCGDEDILRHCREQGPHARGCWVLDLLLGKE